VVSEIALPAGGARAVARCDALGVPPYSDTQDGLYRGYLTPAHEAAIERVAGWMRDAGMIAHIDQAWNLVGRYEGNDRDAPALLIGSHIDSVRDAGRYDGPLGIMLGIELVAALNSADERLPFPVEVIAFGDEEGSRFPAAMFTSRAVAGTLDAATLDVADTDDVSLANALAALGGDIATFPQAARAPGSAFAYLETHIEQGPVLEAEGLALATVTGIAAQLRFSVTVGGMAGHAGTTSMSLRRDALAGAAEMILAIETVARDDASDLVATVGRIEALPGAANVIPGKVVFTIDIRSGDVERRDRAADHIRDEIAAIAERRALDLSISQVHDLPASPCDPRLMDLMDAALLAEGFPARRLVSGAGHDAMVMATLCPTTMLFVRCAGGVSHNPAEHVAPADADAALRVMLNFTRTLADASLS
jgi:allantoate deiminase